MYINTLLVIKNRFQQFGFLVWSQFNIILYINTSSISTLNLTEFVGEAWRLVLLVSWHPEGGNKNLRGGTKSIGISWSPPKLKINHLGPLTRTHIAREISWQYWPPGQAEEKILIPEFEGPPQTYTKRFGCLTITMIPTYAILSNKKKPLLHTLFYLSTEIYKLYNATWIFLVIAMRYSCINNMYMLYNSRHI